MSATQTSKVFALLVWITIVTVTVVDLGKLFVQVKLSCYFRKEMITRNTMSHVTPSPFWPLK